jgi:hypothetical protein
MGVVREPPERLHSLVAGPDPALQCSE